MAVAGSLQLSSSLGFCGNRDRRKLFKYVSGRRNLHLSADNLSSSASRQDLWSHHLSTSVNSPLFTLPNRCSLLSCNSFLFVGQNVTIPTVKSATDALARSYNSVQGIPLVRKLAPPVCIVIFALWGLQPLMQLCRKIFVHKSDSSWKKSTTNYVTTSYLQPILLWTAAILICRTLDPVVMPTESSQLVKQRLLNFVKSLSTVLAAAFCLSSGIQQTQKYFMESNMPSDSRNMGFQFAGKAVYSAVWVAAISLFMELLGFSTQKWLTAGGLGTVLLTLAGREIFTNFLSSIMIHATRPFVINEWIQTQIDGYEVSGTVEMDDEASNCVQSKHVLYDIDEEGTDEEEGFVDGIPHQSNIPSSTHDIPTNNQVSNKKLTSEAWIYFDKVEVGEIIKARCKKCSKHLSTGGNSGTSHLVKHGKTTCPMRHLGSHVGQKKLRVQTNLDGSNTLELKEKYKEFDQEVSRSKLVNMVVIHEYPLSIVDHYWFRDFIKSLNPSFKMVSRNTLKTNILKLYNDDKLSLKQLLGFNESRIAVTTDMWTASNQKKGYMVVTSHFIDRNWVLRNRTLRFCFVPCPHTKGVLAKVLMDCLSQYCLESKISSVVVDNCSTNDAMMKILLKNFESKCLILKGSFLHLRCSAHILNLIVKDGLNVIESGIVKVRNCVSFWMSTPKRIEKFEEACRFFGKTNITRLVLDCKTRWNSTFYMLQSALPYKDVFVRLKRLNTRLKFDVPSSEDWILASLVCEKLDIFDNATKVFSGRHYPTSNLFFRKACEIKLALMSWLEDDVEIIKEMAKGMIEKFDKYWEHINGLLAIAAILDPRNKMDCVSFYFKILYGDEVGEKEVERVRHLLDELVMEYQKHSEGSSKENSSQVSGKRKHLSSHVVHQDAYAREKETITRKVIVKGEVEHYLEDQPEREDESFDVLSWWKIDRRYPTLRTIAKDILAIPISSVASESAFSMGGRVVSAHRSRLHANTVEALMCLQNWKMQDFQGDMEGTSSCSTINEDSEVDGDIIDIIDMDVDDIPIDDMEEEELYDMPCIV